MEINPGFLIMTLYIIISGNFMAPLLSCNLQTLLSDSMIMRHLIGILTFIFFVGVTNVKQESFTKVLLYSAGMYAWFIATTRMDIRFWVPLIGLFSVLFLVETYKNTLNENELEQKKTSFESIKSALVVASAVLTILGSLTYLGSKKIEYGSNFSYDKFVFGKATCRLASPKLNIITALRGLTKN